MDDFKTEKWTLEDGRRAERRVTESVQPGGEAERVVELHVEDERPLRLQQRVVEKRKPFVYEREIHTVDKTGNVVEKKVESIEPKVQMQLVEHIAADGGVTSLADSAPVTGQPTDDCDCHVTKEEMIETIVTAVRALKDEIASSIPAPVVVQQPAPQPVPATPAPGSLADEIAKRIGANNSNGQPANNGMMDKVLWGVIIVLVIGLGYVIFGM